jgi:TPR repeat protein
MRLIWKVVGLSLALAGRAEALVSTPALEPDQTEQGGSPPADDAHCTTCDGVRLLWRGEYDRAMHVFQLRAAAGDPAATNNIGYMYEEGLGVDIDYDRARQYYAKAIKAGGGGGMSSLGWMYQQGHGVAVDYNQARRYYAMAKDAGDPVGATLLGVMYEHGEGVPIDYGQAMSLYHEAIVDGGDPGAMEQIGFMLQHGLGGPPNPKEAWCWYMWAEANGQSDATTHLAELTVAGQQPVRDCSVLNKWPVKVRRQATASGAPAPRQP